MKEDLSNITDERLKATYLLYRDGDDTYQFDEIKDEFTRRDKAKLWGKHNEPPHWEPKWVNPK